MVIDPFKGGYAAGFDRDEMYYFMRADWDSPRQFRMADQHPAFNVAGLYFLDPADA